MTNEQLLTYLKANKHLLNISGIAKLAGISNLPRIVDERPDGRGYLPKLNEKHVQKLLPIIKSLQL